MLRKKISNCVILSALIVCMFCAPLVATGLRGAFAESEDINLIAPPTVIEEVLNAEAFEGLGNGTANGALLYLSEEGNIVDGEGAVIESLQNAVAALKGKVVFNLAVESEGQAQALLNYTVADMTFTDATIVSSSAEILGKIKESDGAPWFRCALDLTGGVEDVSSAILAANTAGANIVVLSQDFATEETVYKFQAMAKTVWVKLNGSEEFDVLKGLASGAFGLIGNAESIKSAFRIFEGTEGDVILRRPLNIAHRGDPYLYNENSIEGCESAYNNGATHLELDFRLTQDGEIVVMHDASINRTTNGTGNVASLTLAQIKNCSITKNIAGIETGTASDIPSIDDVFAFMQENDTVLYFEIKSEEEALVDKMKTKIEEYGLQDRIVVISFSKTQIERVRTKMPYLWALDLNYSSITSFDEYVMNLCYAEAGYDIPKAMATDTGFVSDMIDRGFMPMFWTYDDQSSVYSAVWDGVFGITNNCASEAGAITCGIAVDECRAEKDSVLDKTAEIAGKTIVSNYGAGEQTVCKIVAVKDCGTYAEAVVIGQAQSVYALDTVKIIYGSKESAGCAGTLAVGALPVCAAVAVLSVVVLLRRNKRKY